MTTKKKKKSCQVCARPAYGGCGYCLHHLPTDKRCNVITNKGTQCKLPAMNGADICKHHHLPNARGRSRYASGWIYVFDTKFHEDGKTTYKIGQSKNPLHRLSELRSGNPYGEILFAGFIGRRVHVAEVDFQKMFKKERVEREMFALDTQQLMGLRVKLRVLSSRWYENNKFQDC